MVLGSKSKSKIFNCFETIYQQAYPLRRVIWRVAKDVMIFGILVPRALRRCMNDLAVIIYYYTLTYSL